jgi:hypothetical protein
MDKDFKGVQEILEAEYGWEDDMAFVPSMQDFNRLRKWVCWQDGIDADGRWSGFCPIHDRSRRSEGSAVWDFVKGMFRCNGEHPCHEGKRAISINNLYLELAYQRLA